MRDLDFLNLSGAVADEEGEADGLLRPDIDPATGLITAEPYRYMTHDEWREADPELRRGWVQYVRTVYSVTTTRLAREWHVRNQTLSGELRAIGVQALTGSDAVHMGHSFDPRAWQAFVTADIDTPHPAPRNQNPAPAPTTVQASTTAHPTGTITLPDASADRVYDLLRTILGSSCATITITLT